MTDDFYENVEFDIFKKDIPENLPEPRELIIKDSQWGYTWKIRIIDKIYHQVCGDKYKKKNSVSIINTFGGNPNHVMYAGKDFFKKIWQFINEDEDDENKNQEIIQRLIVD